MKKQKTIDEDIPLSKDLRMILKRIIQDELRKLPDQLETMEPRQRIETLIRLLPFVLPRVEPVSMNTNEPWDMTF